MTAPVLSVAALQIRLDPQGASTHAVLPAGSREVNPRQKEAGRCGSWDWTSTACSPRR